MSAPIDTTLPDDPDELRRLALVGKVCTPYVEDLERRVQAEEAFAAKLKRAKRRKPAAVDVDRAGSTVAELLITLYACHNTAWHAVAGNPEQMEDALTVIRATLRTVIRALDQCGQRLGQVPAGYFDDDMEGH